MEAGRVGRVGRIEGHMNHRGISLGVRIEAGKEPLNEDKLLGSEVEFKYKTGSSHHGSAVHEPN